MFLSTSDCQCLTTVGEKVGEIPTLEQVQNKEVKIEFNSFETSLDRTDPTYPVRSRFSCYEHCTNALRDGGVSEQAAWCSRQGRPPTLRAESVVN